MLLIPLFPSPRAATEYLLWYNAPPKGNWISDHLPLGNSLFGASLMGGVARDSLILNAARPLSGNRRGTTA